MKFIFLLFSLLIVQSGFGWQDKLELARNIKLSPYLRPGEAVDGPAGTWINLFSFSVGGILKAEKNYCFYYKVPMVKNMGRISLVESPNGNCEWKPGLSGIWEVDELEYLIINYESKKLEFKYSRKSRNHNLMVHLYNNGVFPGVFLVPTDHFLRKKTERELKPLCGQRNHQACVRKLGDDKRDQCLEVEKYYFCNPGTSASCRDQKVFCL